MSNLWKAVLITLLVVVLAGTSYAAGFASHWALVQFQAPQQASTALQPAAPKTAGSQPTAGQPAQFKVFWEAWDLLQKDFYGEIPDSQQMTYDAIRGVLSNLKDPNTILIDPKQTKLEESGLSGRFEGIGAVVSMNESGELVVVTPMAGQPAEQAGLKAGDIILTVDGKEVKGMDLTDAVLLIRGPRGTKVKLTVFRVGEPNNLEFEITRGQIETQSIAARTLDQAPEIGYIRLMLFGERTTDELRTAIQDLKGKGAKSLIIDLRNNPGGRLDTAISVTSQFVKSGPVTFQRSKDGSDREYDAQAGGIATDIPVVFLVNKGSASASEIVAGAIKHYQRGKLVGEKTFGKGTVQNVYTLSDGATLHVTISHWLTPAKEEINGKGITPDVEVVLTEADARAQHDTQLDRAIQILKGGS